MTAATIDGTTVITEPGVYDLDDATYHADPVPDGSLSCSGAKKLLPPSCPAIFDYERNNPPPPKAVFDMGHAAHQMVLGVGPELVEVNADDWRTNKAKAAAVDARARGAVPLLSKDMAIVRDMEAALRRHPVASALLSDGGHAEQSLFWRDERTGIMRRCRLDWHPSPRAGRMVAFDYKTAASADPEKFAKAAMDHGYFQQADWYLEGLRALDLAGDEAQFVFVVQEKTAPYLVTVAQLDAIDLRIGGIRNRLAIDIYTECTASGVWHGYNRDEVAHVSLPYWFAKQYEGLL